MDRPPYIFIHHALPLLTTALPAAPAGTTPKPRPRLSSTLMTRRSACTRCSSQATDTVAWSGLTGMKKCIVQGLCNPQYVFYHTGYRIILNTWQSQGTAADCEYLEDCKGLCNSGVLNQLQRAATSGAATVPSLVMTRRTICRPCPTRRPRLWSWATPSRTACRTTGRGDTGCTAG